MEQYPTAKTEVSGGIHHGLQGRKSIDISCLNSVRSQVLERKVQILIIQGAQLGDFGAAIRSPRSRQRALT